MSEVEEANSNEGGGDPRKDIELQVQGVKPRTSTSTAEDAAKYEKEHDQDGQK
ncbi:hypothetical protein [Sphingomonas nostoxanthinifaciens]|uniref:hypothetical protein n=1 Tax=Sphingomonas nostoxanthinifaciens TaxID=2872652 RepID=UPI001CC204D5|nr:hypothetical protein [Sphingomonas nostoxanthinifaciens]UAK25570.1 hypothetical protein K8P63_05295 [Sphingomonas nostoxanthinifaciens]